MTPVQSEKEELYNFFENIERYIEHGKSIEDIIDMDKSPTYCDSFTEQWGNISGSKEIAKNICIRFISLYKYLSEGKNNYRDNANYKNDCGFLNYWVNWKIQKGEFKEDTSVSDFRGYIDSHVLHVMGYYVAEDLIYDIDKDELNKMNNLFNLYEKYSKLNDLINDESGLDKQSLLSVSTECCIDYIKASNICNPDYNNNNNINSKFCEKLKNFESEYEKLYKKDGEIGSDISDNFIRLSECGNTKIMSNKLLGSMVGIIPLFGILYKFTPMRQMFRSKKGILNNDISNNDEEMIKMSFMEQENESLRFEQETYNIKYQPV
ncbi:Plasmodium vivax Vir protein, putative [Plasmodium vivax]|nr:Plasmodium vivax Vir protein, putative [Plasmodium vivax]